MTTVRLRPDLPPLPARIARLPRSRGYPVPWFVAWVDGSPEFRVADSRKREAAVARKLCWVCGQKLGPIFAFVIGPMCSVNRISAEPPCHLECAEFSAVACPFLSRPQMVRREGGMPGAAQDAPGLALMRNPGVTLAWVCRSYEKISAPGGWLLRLPDPRAVHAYREGRKATKEELRESIVSGLPQLRDLAAMDGDGALQELARLIRQAQRVLGITRLAVES